MRVKITDIRIERKKRQRRKLEHLDELKRSIDQIGLINPITLGKDNVLLAGERRLEAVKQLGWATIPAVHITDLDEASAHLIELEENVRRDNLPWQDHVKAIHDFHTIKCKQVEGWSKIDTSLALDLSPTKVNKDLLMAANLDDEDIASTKQYQAAYNKSTQKKKRAEHSALDNISIDLGLDDTLSAPIQRKWHLLNESFLDWVEDYDGQRFNFVHCDFPYGIEHDKQNSRIAKSEHVNYADDWDTAKKLLRTFLAARESFLLPTAHIMFWYAPSKLRDILGFLNHFEIYYWHTPLIWYKSDNKGIAPDARYQPRHVYEAALMINIGNRPVAKAGVGDCFAHRVVNQLHKSEKPVRVLQHFFQMFVDENTIMLDPTCGCGNSVKVSEAMGAKFSLGIELDKEIFQTATNNLEN